MTCKRRWAHAIDTMTRSKQHTDRQTHRHADRQATWFCRRQHAYHTHSRWIVWLYCTVRGQRTSSGYIQPTVSSWHNSSSSSSICITTSMITQITVTLHSHISDSMTRQLSLLLQYSVWNCHNMSHVLISALLADCVYSHCNRHVTSRVTSCDVTRDVSEVIKHSNIWSQPGLRYVAHYWQDQRRMFLPVSLQWFTHCLTVDLSDLYLYSERA